MYDTQAQADAPADIGDTLADELDELVETTPAVAVTQTAFEPDSTTVVALINDVALKMHSYVVIAKRYGLSIQQLYDFISIPVVTRRVKARRAEWESDDNLPDRNRRLYGAITLEAASVLDGMLHNPTVLAAAKLDAFKIAGKFAGLESMPKPIPGDNSPTGPQFSVQIVFSGGAVEKITTTPEAQPPLTIEGAAA